MSPVSVSTGFSSADFMEALQRVFDRSLNFMRDYADPDVDTITLDGLGTFNKDSDAMMLASTVYMQKNQEQAETISNYLTYIYKTLPQQINQAFTS